MYKTKIVVIFFLLLSVVACSQENNKIKDNQNSDSNSDAGNTKNTITARQFIFPSSKYVMVAAHRAGGYKHGTPENSLSAIKHSLDLGVDIIEIDVRITLDHKLIVMHDNTLDRTTNGSGKISHHTLDEIKKLFLKGVDGAITNERVLTLEEVMLAVGNKAIVFIDKSELVLDYVVPVLNKTNSINNSLFIDFIDFKETKKRYGDLLTSAYFVPGIHESNSTLDSYFSEFKEAFAPQPSAFAFWFKEENSKSFSLIERAKNSIIPIWINTTTIDQCAGHTDEVSLVNPDQGWGWVINQGANIIFTDEPEALINYLASKGLR